MIPILNNNGQVDMTNPAVNAIATGNKMENPEYNPKTKKGRAEPKYIDIPPQRFDTGLGSSFVNSAKQITGVYSDYGYTPDDVDKYIKNGIVGIKYKSREDLDKAIADKQSALEQAGNAVVQAVGNEVVLGTLLGFSNLADLMINFGKDAGDDDYTNPVSKQIEEWQDALREKFVIHRADPNASWAVGDFGWWMDNAVSVLSSASMLLPTLALTKGASAIGRYTQFGQKLAKGLNKTSHTFARGINSMTKPLTGGDRIGRIQKSISAGTEISTNAFISRTLENYMEARGVYKEVYDSILQRIQSHEFDKEQLLKTNPEFEGKSDEEIASHIASLSADETFQNDYAMLAMDIIQFKALKNLWKGKLKNNNGAGVAEFNIRAAQNIGRETPINPKITFKDRLNYLKNNPGKGALDVAKSIEFTEGIEEGYQGIQIEKGKEVAEKILNPKFVSRDNLSYLTDDKITEQAFWGVLGGVGFKAIGKGFGRLTTEADIAYNKKFAKEDKKYTEKQIALMRQGVERQQIDEILGREARIREFNDQMQNLNETNVSNFQTVKDEKGQDLVDAEGNKVYKTLTEEEKEQEKRDIIDAFITDMTIDSAIAGTYDLLREYVKTPEVRRVLNESQQDTMIEDTLLANMDNVYNKFANNVYNVWNSVDVVNDYIGNKVARDITLDQIRLEQTQAHLDEVKEQANKINAKPEDVQAYLDKARKDILRDIYNDRQIDKGGISYIAESIDKRLSHIEKAYANNDITQQAYNEYIKDINRERRALFNYAQKHLNAFEGIDLSALGMSTISDQLKQFIQDDIKVGNPNDVPDSLKQLLDEQAYTEFEIANREEAIPVTQEQIKDTYEAEDLRINEYTQAAYALAANEVRQWIRNQDDLSVVPQKLADNSVEELKDALDILKMGHWTTQAFIGSILQEVDAEQRRRDKQEKEDSQTIIDGQQTTGVEAKRDEELIENADSFTGETQQTETTTTTATDDSGQEVEVAVPEDEVEEFEKQAIADAKKADENYEISNDSIASSMATTILMNMTSEDKGIVEVLRRGINTQEYNDLLNKVAEELITKGVTPEKAIDYARQGMSAYAVLLHRVFKDDIFLHLAGQIATNSSNFASNNKFFGEQEFDEIVEKFIDEYVKINNIELAQKGRTIINTKRLVKDIVENKEIPYEIAVLMLRNLRNYLVKNKNKKYIFDNRNFVYGINNNKTTIEQLIEDAKYSRAEEILIDDNLHISLPSTREGLSRSKKKLLETDGRGVLTFEHAKAPDGKPMQSISVKLDGVEIGYLGRVTNDVDGTNLRLSSPTIGFAYRFTPTDSNNVYAVPNCPNLDAFFEAVIKREGLGSEIYELVDKYRRNEITLNDPITEEDAIKLLNNRLIIGLMDGKQPGGKSLYVRGNGNIERANNILKHLKSIIFFNSDINTVEMRLKSYGIWKLRMFHNYKQTQDIQQRLDNGEKVDGKVAQITIKSKKSVNYDSNTRNNVSQMGFRYERNPIVYYLDSATAVDDNGNTYSNFGKYSVGSAGILIGTQGTGTTRTPIIASIVDTIKVNDSSFAIPARNELTELITGFSSGKIGYNELSKKLSNLIGGTIDGRGVKGNHLLSGARIVQKGGKLAIINNNNKVVAIFYRDVKTGDKQGTGITYFNGKYAGGKQSFIVPNATIINDIVKEVIAELKFNINYMMAKNRAILDYSNNEYFAKQNGKFVIKLKGAEKVYNNYTQFILDNNIAITNQKINEDGSLFSESEITGVSVEAVAKDTTTLPVKRQFTNRSITNILESATEDNPGNTTELLEAVGFNDRTIAVIQGKTEGIPSLVSDSFIYDATLPEQGMFNNGKIYIGQTGINEIKGGRTRALRLLVHEKLHDELNKRNVFAQANIVTDLLRTYNDAISYAKSLKKGDANYDIAQKFLNWIETQKFNPTDYANTLSDRITQNSNISPERRFAEEWLVESLTMPGVSEFLNIAPSERGVLDTENKTIWQKIIETLLKLLGVGTKHINNLSILAEQYNIISKYDTTINVETESKTDTRIDDAGAVQLSGTTVTSEEIETAVDEEIDIDEDLIFDDFDFASRNEYFEASESGLPIVHFNNIEEYINSFPEVDRDGIRKLVDKNGINFQCYV